MICDTWHIQVSWQRSGRTDKGVSAIAQIVSLKMSLPAVEAGVDAEIAMVEELNQHLPDDIRVFDVVRTTNSFDAKNTSVDD
jgi:tRNA pseudouridine38-40 synthase